jgi:hypothetical protein
VTIVDGLVFVTIVDAYQAGRGQGGELRLMLG